MEYIVAKGSGTVIGNVLRQIALTQLEAVSVIAYAIGDNSTIISPGNNSILEDMVEFGNNLTSYVYTMDTDWKKVSVTFDETLTIQHLEDEGVSVINPNASSGELLHALEGPITVTIYFRKSHNVSYVEDNKYFLESKGVDLSHISVINSRYMCIDNFTYSVSPHDDKTEILNISVKGILNEAEEEIMIKVMSTLDDILDVIRGV